jgi:hypothetical protein
MAGAAGRASDAATAAMMSFLMIFYLSEPFYLWASAASVGERFTTPDERFVFFGKLG